MTTNIYPSYGEADAERFVQEARAQLRRLGLNNVGHFTSALDGGGKQVPIEACRVMVVHPDDELRVRSLGEKYFLPRRLYPPNSRPRALRGEIGYLLSTGVVIVVDPDHGGSPVIYGAGELPLTLEPQA